MTEIDKKEIQEYITQAVESGKSDTSGLVSSMMSRIDKGIESSIEKYVNGHLRDVKKNLEYQDGKLVEIHIEQKRVAEELRQIKLKTEPLIESRETIVNVGKFVVWLGAICGAGIGIFYLVDTLFKINN